MSSNSTTNSLASSSSLTGPFTVAIIFLAICISTETYYLQYLVRAINKGGGGLNFKKGLQICTHSSSFLMMALKLIEVSLIWSGGQSPILLSSLQSIFSFIFNLLSSVYYLEILKTVEVILTSKYLMSRYIFTYQIIEIGINFLCSTPILFRYYLFKDDDPHSFLAQWALMNAVTIVETSLEGLFVMYIIFQAFTKLLTENETKQNVDGPSPAFQKKRRINQLMWLFCLCQVLLFASYSINGVFTSTIMALPFSAIGISISGFEICLFTTIFERTASWFATPKTHKPYHSEALISTVSPSQKNH